MLTRVDRVQVVVGDRAAAAAGYKRLLGAEKVGEDRVDALAARRTVLRLGVSEVELLEPDGSGAAADFLSDMKGGLFAAGFATQEIGFLAAHLRDKKIAFVEESSQLLISQATPGLRVVVTPEEERRPVGLLRFLYEVTNLVGDYESCVPDVAATFGLDKAHFVPIRSEEFGYEGTLTLFHPQRLDRLEIITPNNDTKTMGRFFAKRGPCLYMCYGEADDPATIRERLLEHAPEDWTGPRNVAVPDNLFIHPKALHGLMVGISRTSFAWTWSGYPERVRHAGRQ